MRSLSGITTRTEVFDKQLRQRRAYPSYCFLSELELDAASVQPILQFFRPRGHVVEQRLSGEERT